MGINRHCCKDKEVIYPTRENVEHVCTEETVRHIHPHHTTVINHHTVKNEHLYPETTSYEREVNEINVQSMNQGWGNDDVSDASFPERNRGSSCNVCNRSGCSGRCGNKGKQTHCHHRDRRSWI